MFTISRVKLLSAAAMIAITLVVGGWTFPAQEGRADAVSVDAWPTPAELDEGAECSFAGGGEKGLKIVEWANHNLGSAETFTVDIVAQPGPIETGSYCYGTVGVYGAQSQEITYSWSGAFWNASTRNVEGYFYNSGWQYLEVWDCEIAYDDDSMYFEVSETGDPCLP